MTTDLIIVGAGFAGLAAAEALLRRGVKSVTVIERESGPGQHASGRNAGMIRQAGVAPDVQPALIRGARAIQAIFQGSGSFLPCGSLLLAGREDLDQLARDVECSHRLGLAVKRESRDAAIARVPILERAQFEEALWCPSDGVLDIHALLSYLQQRVKALGGALRMDMAAWGFERSGDRVTRVLTNQGPLACEGVVNAGGAWVEEIGAWAGARPLRFQPYRRHLMFTGTLPWVRPDWPFVWDITQSYYFRPETGGLLMSPCDEEPAERGWPQVDPRVIEGFAERLGRVCPALAGVPVQRVWAGLRTFSEDRRPVIGADPEVANFYWLAGQGGHGVTGCLAFAEALADAVTGQTFPEAAWWSPSRFPARAVR